MKKLSKRKFEELTGLEFIGVEFEGVERKFVIKINYNEDFAIVSPGGSAKHSALVIKSTVQELLESTKHDMTQVYIFNNKKELLKWMINGN